MTVVAGVTVAEVAAQLSELLGLGVERLPFETVCVPSPGGITLGCGEAGGYAVMEAASCVATGVLGSGRDVAREDTGVVVDALSPASSNGGPMGCE